MKAVAFNGPKAAKIIDMPEPRIVNRFDVKIRVRYVSICADDLESFVIGVETKAVGHEFSGVITELGHGAAEVGYEIGDRVTGYVWRFCGRCPYCRRGQENLCLNMHPQRAMQEYIVLDSNQICKILDKIPLKLASVSEVVASCIHAVERAQIHIGDSVLLLGGGGAGMIMLQLVRMCGAASVTVSEPIASKRQLCKALGADETIDPYSENLVAQGMEITDGLGYQCVFDVSKNEAALPEGISLLARGGTFLLFSLHERKSNITIDLPTLYSKEITLLTSFMAPYLLDRAMEILPKLNLEVLDSDPFPLEHAQEAYEAAYSGKVPRVFVEVTK